MAKKAAMSGELLPEEKAVFSRLRSPAAIQNFLNAIPFNHEESGETYMSPRRALAAQTAHCFEGALIAAAALMYHGHKPLLMDFQTTKDDTDHVVALFKRGAFWGAISKTNHGTVRYRDAVYATPRELALSYFHEYFLNDGTKTLRAFSRPFDLSRYELQEWLTSPHELIDIVNELDAAPHIDIVPKGMARTLKKADPIETAVWDREEWPKGSC